MITARYDTVSDPDYQFLELRLSCEAFYVVNMYNEKPTLNLLSQLTLQRFLDLNPQMDKPFLFLGDVNLHHSSWNPEVQNNTLLANNLVRYLDSARAQIIINSAIIEEYGGTFHRSNSRKTSIIDLAFAARFQQ